MVKEKRGCKSILTKCRSYCFIEICVIRQWVDEIQAVARIRTLTILPRLDPTRKKSVIRFLYESRLIHTHKTIVDLSFADLRNADLHSASLQGVNLSRSSLRDADLSKSELGQADLSGARLEKANLTQANLGGAKSKRGAI